MEGGDRVVVLVFCHMIEDKASLFRTLFTHSRYGIIVTWPIYNAKRQIDDAWIINQNAAAMPITGGSGSHRGRPDAAGRAGFLR